MNAHNRIIAEAMFYASMKSWQVAELLGCADGTFSRYMRQPVPEETQKMIADAIKANDKTMGIQALVALRKSVLREPNKQRVGKSMRPYNPLKDQHEMLSDDEFSKYYLET